MRMMQIILFFVMVGVLTQPIQCISDAVEHDSDEVAEGPLDNIRGFIRDKFARIAGMEDNRDGGKALTWGEIRPSDILSSVEYILESELAELKEQVSTLTEALLPTSSKRVRSPRSTTIVTSSDYFGTGMHGNCTCRGDPGPVGPSGIPGRDGRDGRDALPTCSDSTNQPATQPDLTTSYYGDQTPSPSGSPGNGIYVRWGRTVCRSGSELVYEGFIGGSHSADVGGGSNHQCLPLEPIYDQVVSGTLSNTAKLYGAQMGIHDMPDHPWFSLHRHGPPCAVCLALRKPTILMIPARNVCPSSSWTLEYWGLLVAQGSDKYRTEFICVDRHLEAIPDTANPGGGVILNPVEGMCATGNSMPCGPYVHGSELSCAVCSM